ncbi:MAG: hypothetical protein R3F14_06415 [Polyangiaceae bacterium]
MDGNPGQCIAGNCLTDGDISEAARAAVLQGGAGGNGQGGNGQGGGGNGTGEGGDAQKERRGRRRATPATPTRRTTASLGGSCSWLAVPARRPARLRGALPRPRSRARPPPRSA